MSLFLLAALSLAADRPAELRDLRYAERVGDRLLVRTGGVGAPTGPWSGHADASGWRTVAPTSPEPDPTFPRSWIVEGRACTVVDYVVAVHEWTDSDYEQADPPRCGQPDRYAVLDCAPGPKDALAVPAGVTPPTVLSIGDDAPDADRRPQLERTDGWKELLAAAHGAPFTAAVTSAPAGPGRLVHLEATSGAGEWYCGGEDFQADLFAWYAPEHPKQPAATWTLPFSGDNASAVILLESGPVLELEGARFLTVGGVQEQARVRYNCICGC